MSGVGILLGRLWNGIGTGKAPIPRVLDTTTTSVILVESEELVLNFVPSQSYSVSDIAIKVLLMHDAFGLEHRRSQPKAVDSYMNVPCVIFGKQYWNKNVRHALNSNATAQND